VKQKDASNMPLTPEETLDLLGAAHNDLDVLTENIDLSSLFGLLTVLVSRGHTRKRDEKCNTLNDEEDK
jgi:hypothetical protein